MDDKDREIEALSKLPLPERTWEYIKKSEPQYLYPAVTWALEAYLAQEVDEVEYGRMCSAIANAANGEASFLTSEWFTLNGRADQKKKLMVGDPQKEADELAIRADHARVTIDRLTSLAAEHRQRAFEVQQKIGPTGRSVYDRKTPDQPIQPTESPAPNV